MPLGDINIDSDPILPDHPTGQPPQETGNWFDTNKRKSQQAGRK